uniref:Uncharacterized protein LOC111137511 isoform X4 n=1 Tax=Crassostrea virginica TaxID=6565 RepID=A0A8B8EXH6_CRAVI|nr:uncharacterized protein LOC111137511 isoform X4 [Crassostrea virginica]
MQEPTCIMNMIPMLYSLLTIPHVATFGNVQMLLAENLVKWSAADKVCTEMFNGSHLATEILEGAPDYNLIAMKNFQSVWLNSKVFNLGCRGELCFLVIIRQRRLNSYDFKHLCVNDGALFVGKNCEPQSITNITLPVILVKIFHKMPGFAFGKEFVIKNVINVSADYKCKMARKHGHEFREMFTSCDEFHLPLCEHYLKSSPLVTTIEYREESLRIYQSIFLQHPDPKEYHERKEIIWTSLSIVAGVASLFLCAGLFIYCKRKKQIISSIYDTVFMRPRGRNPYILRVPNGPTTPITEPANVLVPPLAPAAGTQQVDSVQTLASSSSFATASTSSPYVDVRYFRNCSYETQASVATSRAPRTEIQPNTPSMSGRLYCSSCRRHRRRRDFQRTSSNCTSCSSQYSVYTGYSAIADRNPSLETTDTNNRGPQRLSKDNNDSHSVSSHRSHRSRRSHWSVLSTFSRKKSQMDRMTTEQQQASGLALQDNVKMSNPNIKKDNRVDRVSSAGLRLVKKMFSIDLK